MLPRLSAPLLVDSPDVYSVVEGASKHGKPLLVCTDGYSYAVTRRSESAVKWRCSQRCGVYVSQVGDQFERVGDRTHTHSARPGLHVGAEITAKVLCLVLLLPLPLLVLGNRLSILYILLYSPLSSLLLGSEES